MKVNVKVNGGIGGTGDLTREQADKLYHPKLGTYELKMQASELRLTWPDPVPVGSEPQQEVEHDDVADLEIIHDATTNRYWLKSHMPFFSTGAVVAGGISNSSGGGGGGTTVAWGTANNGFRPLNIEGYESESSLLHTVALQGHTHTPNSIFGVNTTPSSTEDGKTFVWSWNSQTGTGQWVYGSASGDDVTWTNAGSGDLPETGTDPTTLHIGLTVRNTRHWLSLYGHSHTINQIFPGVGAGPDDNNETVVYNAESSQWQFRKVGTVTSVALTVPTGLSVSGSPITSSGTLAVSLASGYTIPTTENVNKGVTAYEWGNHADAGYQASLYETGNTGRPVFINSNKQAQVIDYLNVGTEQGSIVLPFFTNDIAFLQYRGGSVTITGDTSIPSTANPTQALALFDGKPDYTFFHAPSTSSTVVITIYMPTDTVYNYGERLYIDFGSASFRAKSITVEVFTRPASSSDPADDAKYDAGTKSVTNLAYSFWNPGQFSLPSEHRIGHLVISLTDFARTDFRISEIGLQRYASNGLSASYMSRGLDEPVWRHIRPGGTTYMLGTYDAVWDSVYTKNVKNSGSQIFMRVNTGSDGVGTAIASFEDTGVYFYKNALPGSSVSGTIDLGSSSRFWKRLYLSADNGEKIVVGAKTFIHVLDSNATLRIGQGYQQDKVMLMGKPVEIHVGQGTSGSFTTAMTFNYSYGSGTTTSYFNILPNSNGLDLGSSSGSNQWNRLYIKSEGGAVYSGGKELLFSNSNNTDLNYGYNDERPIRIFGSTISVFKGGTGNDNRALQISDYNIIVGYTKGFSLIPAATSGQTYSLGKSTTTGSGYLWDKMFVKKWYPTNSEVSGAPCAEYITGNTAATSYFKVTGNFAATGYIVAGGLTNTGGSIVISSDLVPTQNGQFKLGDTNAKFSYLYVNHIGDENNRVPYSHLGEADITTATIANTTLSDSLTITHKSGTTWQSGNTYNTFTPLSGEIQSVVTALSGSSGGVYTPAIIISNLMSFAAAIYNTGRMFFFDCGTYKMLIHGCYYDGSTYDLYIGRYWFHQTDTTHWLITRL